MEGNTPTLHSSDIRALDIIFKLGDLLLQLIHGHLLVLCKGDEILEDE